VKRGTTNNESRDWGIRFMEENLGRTVGN